MSRRRLTAALAGLSLVTGLSLVGCSPDAAASLTVRLQTGLRAGHEVRFVETRLFAGS